MSAKIKNNNSDLEIASPMIDRFDESSFLGFIGDRVRKIRVSKKLSRKRLSELSGVSQRYLAQLEGGSGNISVLLLYRIAEALDERVQWLLRPDNHQETDVLRMITLLKNANIKQRQQVLNILEPEQENAPIVRRLAFVGLRGAGKTTLGQLTAKKLGLPFHELNKDIERGSGIPVNEVMALYGIEGYRKLELLSLKNLINSNTSMVLAVAGGIVNEPETYHFLMQNCVTIWLKASPEEHMARVRSQGDERPMAGNPDAMRQLKAILAERQSQYAQADIVVDTSGKLKEQSLSEVINVLSRQI
jgi:XRE family aerobic/anaerobic benzoate catabolism transcriptional regulator